MFKDTNFFHSTCQKSNTFYYFFFLDFTKKFRTIIYFYVIWKIFIAQLMYREICSEQYSFSLINFTFSFLFSTQSNGSKHLSDSENCTEIHSNGILFFFIYARGAHSLQDTRTFSYVYARLIKNRSARYFEIHLGRLGRSRYYRAELVRVRAARGFFSKYLLLPRPSADGSTRVNNRAPNGFDESHARGRRRRARRVTVYRTGRSLYTLPYRFRVDVPSAIRLRARRDRCVRSRSRCCGWMAVGPLRIRVHVRVNHVGLYARWGGGRGGNEYFKSRKTRGGGVEEKLEKKRPGAATPLPSPPSYPSAVYRAAADDVRLATTAAGFARARWDFSYSCRFLARCPADPEAPPRCCPTRENPRPPRALAPVPAAPPPWFISPDVPPDRKHRTVAADHVVTAVPSIHGCLWIFTA